MSQLVPQPEPLTHGSCDPAFTAVRDLFAASLASGDDLGAGIAVYVDGRCVVDVWGGLADKKTGRAWSQDTACVTFSCAKAVTATAALLLAQRCVVDLEAPVTEWWPEFGSHGKERTTGTQLLTHQAGLPAFDRPVSVEEAADPVAMAAQLAGQTPEWTPGSAHGYHAITWGWLVGELVRRHTGQTVGEFVRAEFAPHLWIGLPPGALPDVARVAAGRPGRGRDLAVTHDVVKQIVAAAQDPNSPMMRSTTNPSASFNNPLLLSGGWPAAGLVTTARSFAQFYSRLVAGQILDSPTLRDAVRERVRGPDRTMIIESAFGLGYMRPSATMHLPPLARTGGFGHPGASGAMAIGDVECGLAFAYVPNLTRPSFADERGYRLLEAVYAAL